ncbi:ATP phosphoribosyltransferase regulatory subunit [Lysinibacillus irui]|uniref:ATP phosphoribosyltransferase regulatory subunit n=1 Tax=Lysinibacillus irui TaxID=2998077 RepID=A0AAJ5RN16_9BACI|nr:MULTISPECIES: ATP phosphoribosyltransferase regulatory subunit [Lysinibacillus]MEA0553646.1 ATP phosphoribosyltransferase regulatory subunit [Lysinibacillus irui]MEA0564407.1 ATP phosphoribosyltransferase regulatory subunit [Lysinibacillus irui]MEA0976030.1 ATP phosphoribosyltransferase regulatory subunit [Lysinibacillus irui]MEA1042184.1 ATP phosphoribosyltransferase regulatory subunit [Lysinibacillus irui]WDV06213.1 ATP phosphoribosyltransferase regulatory subunit [Lysinibacillus irui]
MSSLKMFEKPLGMRDTFPQIYEKVEAVRHAGRDFLYKRGYEFIKTPAVEYFDTVGKASAIADAHLFKLVDSQGNTLVLRPDMTTPIARVATSKLLKEMIPLRLAYFASVFRAQEAEGGRPAEFDQMGIELIGDQSVFADAEVIVTAMELLKHFKLEEFKVTIGHAGILHCILQDYTESNEQQAILRALLVQRNYVGFEEAVESFDLPKAKTDALLQFIEEAMNVRDIRDIEKYVRKNDALEYMQQLAQLLEMADLAEHVTFDFTLSSHMSYYTGMLFEVFAVGSGFPLGNGGRYDGLLGVFGSKVGATGFSIRVDRLLETLNGESEKQQEATVVLFEEEQFEAALLKVKALRAAGKLATLQLRSSLVDEAAYLAYFTEVVVVGQEEIGSE